MFPVQSSSTSAAPGVILAVLAVLLTGCLRAIAAPVAGAVGEPAAQSTEAGIPPVIPVGLDSYRQWVRWPVQRIGARAYMRSTYDRTGGNEGADASHFLYQRSDDFNVTLDVEGRGVLYFARYNHWHGSPWHYVVDGADHAVRETSTEDPTRPLADSVFLPRRAFPSPLALTWSLTMGADLMWVPIPFERSFQMAYSRTHYGTGYYIYEQYVQGAPLSQDIRSWSPDTAPDDDVTALIGRSGTDIAPRPGTAEADRLGVVQLDGGPISLGRDGTVLVQRIVAERPSMLRAVEFSIPRSQAVEFGKARLRMTWDQSAHPSIEAPVALFFGAGTLYNRDNLEYLVKAFPVNIRYDADRVHLACYFPMPFFESARIEFVGNGRNELTDIRWSVRYQPLEERPNGVGYFHATYRDHGAPERGKDLVLLDTRGVEGGGSWSGSFVGTSFIFSDRADLNTLEGDPRFFFDDSESPQAQGTGTEEWGGGGDYWGGKNMTLPFAGHPVGARDAATARNPEDRIESAYRFLLADLMPFGRNAVICLEHGGTDESEEHYQSVAYWYGIPAASVVKTDVLKVGDAGSELAHRYVSPQSSAPYVINSRYELGVDHLGAPGDPRSAVEVFPAKTDLGRTTVGASEFTLRIEPRNLGVMLRRKLDYSFPNQRAEVYIAAGGEAEPDWRPAGIWYLSGGNTCVYSNPKEELGATEHVVQTSNRRFRDDEFLVPRRLTEGRSSIRVKVKFTPVDIRLFPGHPQGELAWSEIRYDAYCFVMPDWHPGQPPRK